MLILATGGTWDKDYDLISGQLTFAESGLPKLIHQARLTCRHELQILMLKDSLEMTLADRVNILEACRAYHGEQIVIIHGTDTMTETAAFLSTAKIAKTIVLTGAMRPFAFGQSDASFNFGYAIATAQTKASGVYITMQGQCFHSDNVHKDKQNGVFLEKITP